MALALRGGRVLLDDGFHDDVDVVIDGERVVAVAPTGALPAGTPVRDIQGAMLVPGFIDTQVNGGGGVLFNDAPTADAIAAIGRAHRSFGTTGFLPTLISDDLPTVRRAVAATDAAIATGVPGVLGIHIEGPFLNIERKGIHDSTHFRALDADGFAAVTGLRRGRTLVTLAPECTTPSMIRRLADAGIIVAAGHTNGGYRVLREALDHGLSGFTHLFNAMSQLGAREPGAVGAALDDPAAWCGLIVDGHHVDPVTLRIALRCRGADRFLLVTDAMPSVGLASKDFLLQGQPVTVVDGVCRNSDGTLAGADLDMASAVRNTVAMLGLPLETALRMASLHPARFLGLDADRGRIAAGYRADLVLLDDEVRVTDSWIGGVGTA